MRYNLPAHSGVTFSGRPKRILSLEYCECTIYKYLALAYLSPNSVAKIMDGTAPAIDLQTLFAIAAKHTNFKEQEKEFYTSRL